MRLPRDLSGERPAAALWREWGYSKVHQVGSHMVLETTEPTRRRISIPAHSKLRVGNLHGILRAVAEHKRVRREDILKTI